MGLLHRKHTEEELQREQLEELRRIEDTNKRMEQDLDELARDLKPRLRSIKIKFTRVNALNAQRSNAMEGPVVLSSGQSTIASIDFFDQTGAPMPTSFTPPAITYSIDHPEFASSTPNSDGQTDVVTYVSAGVANLSASCTSAEGLALSDTETVTCSPVVQPPPVLSSIKINFAAPTPVAGASAAEHKK